MSVGSTRLPSPFNEKVNAGFYIAFLRYCTFNSVTIGIRQLPYIRDFAFCVCVCGWVGVCVCGVCVWGVCVGCVCVCVVCVCV